MLFPLVVLAILSVIGGWVGVPPALGGHNEIVRFLDPVFADGHAREASARHGLGIALAAISVLIALGGYYVAYLFYWKKHGTAAELADHNQTAYAILRNKYWVDEFYNHFLVIPLQMFTRGFVELIFERGVVNGSVRLAGLATRGCAWFARKQISGNIRSYAGWLALGAAVVIAVMVFGRSLWGGL
jgi:NADH-quinone oxidoreductase subunit L